MSISFQVDLFLENLLVTHQSGKELLMVKTSPANNIYHVYASHVESNAFVCKTEPAAQNTVGMLDLSLMWLTAHAIKCKIAKMPP